MDDDNFIPMTAEERLAEIDKLDREIAHYESVKDLNDRKVLYELAELVLMKGYLLADCEGREDEAIETFFKALDIYTLLEDRVKIGTVKGAIGAVSLAREDYANAGFYFRESLRYLDPDIHLRQIMVSKKGLGIALLKSDNPEDHAEGIKYLTEAADLCVDLQDINNYMEIIVILRNFFMLTENWELFVEIEKKAVKIIENTGNYRETALTYVDLGKGYIALRDYDSALICFKKAVNNALKVGDNLLIYGCLIPVAETYVHLGDKVNAEKEYLRILSLAAYMGSDSEIEKTRLILKALGTPDEKISEAEKIGIKERKSVPKKGVSDKS